MGARRAAADSVGAALRLGRLLKKIHMLRCSRPISRQRTRRVRFRSSIFVRLASEIFLSNLQERVSALNAVVQKRNLGC
jgi:hypothetical protein